MRRWRRYNMENTTKERAVVLLMKAIPYSDQIKDIQAKGDALYFEWRGSKYKLETPFLNISKVEGLLLIKENEKSIYGVEGIDKNIPEYTVIAIQNYISALKKIYKEEVETI